MAASDLTSDTVQIDIVSDVVCPWCIVGYRQLEQALEMTGVTAELRWHPFELNPSMPPDGQNLIEHMAEKYGASAIQSLENRARLQHLGADLGIAFNFTDHSQIVNTFRAHQLLDWAEEHGKQHPLKLALFEAYFSDGLDVSDKGVLTQVARSVGLNAADASEVLTGGAHAQSVRDKQQFWTNRGISGVPAMVFGGKYLLTGAQGAPTYADILRKVQAETAAA
ncbi:DsbA family oxidoreductase [uncultured Roseobacter sp.]|uniref:DsbA family oxidoreductase n=1 Tax=uncultured Roseobacter sp. TaxID=114847 RepID=UPI002619997F|nr:DsbA family oxidoreductase [uncultured Roseobacter sp.]